MQTWRRAALLLLIFLSFACAKPSGPRRVEAAGSYAHVVTELEFPERIGVFRREYVTEYDEAGYDASGHYESPRSLLITATVYHYPANATASPPTQAEFEDHFRGVAGQIRQSTPGGRLLAVQRVTFEINSIGLTGLHAAYEYESFGGYNGQVRTHLYLFALDGWYLKFRFTHPKDIDEVAIEKEIEMIEAMRWPLPPMPASSEYRPRLETFGSARLEGAS